MAANKDHQLVLKQLKKQVSLLQKKEEKSRKKLQAAVKKIKELGSDYKVKLNKKINAMKGKVSTMKGATYTKIAEDIQRKLLKGLESKSKAISSAISKIDKEHAAKLAKGVGKKSKTRKKTARSKLATAANTKKTQTTPKARKKIASKKKGFKK